MRVSYSRIIFVYTPCLKILFFEGEISILVSILKSKIPDTVVYYIVGVFLFFIENYCYNYFYTVISFF